MLTEPFASFRTYAYISPKLEAKGREDDDGHGLFASEQILLDEVLTVWSGIIVNEEQLAWLPTAYRQHSVQIEESLYQVSLLTDEPADYMNHSCDPNAGLRGQVVVVAMRAIAPGEEVCFDYAMSDGSTYDEFECHCGAPNCRGRVTGDDWRRPELWKRYEGYFSPYLQRRIDRLRAEAQAAQVRQPDGLWLETLPVFLPAMVQRREGLTEKNEIEPTPQCP